ncbi:GH11886 [Drosophila grimshawi]|uniref:GH11886 n=1 Tax=Drosophila grimshawi TaxID=7222 RepID=B4JLE3_DROGR|nr:GH11886 [Drosophila grimshawi]
MASTGICFVFGLFLCLCACAWSAPSVDNLSEFGELERTIKELATSVLAMSGVGGGGMDTGDGIVDDFDTDMLGSNAEEALFNLREFYV